jgi:tripeptidyl-peptidase-1
VAGWLAALPPTGTPPSCPPFLTTPCDATWQHAAIASFMATSGLRPSSIDPTQRAVPDLSAYDDMISIVRNGADSSASGTSAAAPMVAGMLADINAALLAAHNTSLGFANPFLYANAHAFLDITTGDNRGIAAVKGYDLTRRHDLTRRDLA